MNADKIIEEYIKITEDAICRIDTDGDLDEIMMRRQGFLEQLSDCFSNKTDLKAAIEKSDMKNVDIKFKEKLDSEMKNIKNEISKIKNQRVANMGYKFKSYGDINTSSLNKTIV